MESIIQTLRENVSFDRLGKTYGDKLNREISFQDKIKEHFGMEFLEAYQQAQDDLHMEEIDRAYEMGFLTAFRLWMEVLAAN